MTGATGPTGPSGSTGATGTVTSDLFSAYSTPTQPGTTGKALVFDRNAVSNSSNITHEANSSNFIINQPGYYYVGFHGTIAPASSVNFPQTISLFLQQQGSAVPGTNIQHTFQTSSDSSNISFSQILQVTSVPSTLSVMQQGGNIQYGGISMDIHKIANLSTT